MIFKMYILTKNLYCMYSFLFQKKSFIWHPLSNMVNLSLRFILWYNLEKAYCFNWITQIAFRSSEKFVLFFTPPEYFCHSVHTVYLKMELLFLTFSLQIYFMSSIRNVQEKEGISCNEKEEEKGREGAREGRKGRGQKGGSKTVTY